MIDFASLGGDAGFIGAAGLARRMQRQPMSRHSRGAQANDGTVWYYGRRESGVQLFFATTLLLSAALLFVVEPMFAKMVLRLLGGSPSVWNTCLVFYQAALLAGYVYAHLSVKWLGGAAAGGGAPWPALPALAGAADRRGSGLDAARAAATRSPGSGCC